MKSIHLKTDKVQQNLQIIYFKSLIYKIRAKLWDKSGRSGTRTKIFCFSIKECCKGFFGGGRVNLCGGFTEKVLIFCFLRGQAP